MSARPGSRGAGALTVGSLRGVPMGSAAGPAPRRTLAAPARPRRCCGTGCVGCPYGDWLRQMRATAGRARTTDEGVDGTGAGP